MASSKHFEILYIELDEYCGANIKLSAFEIDSQRMKMKCRKLKKNKFNMFTFYFLHRWKSAMTAFTSLAELH